eukprot:scaffold1821_cov344-Pavlova_lutheri.AAC.12
MRVHGIGHKAAKGARKLPPTTCHTKLCAEKVPCYVTATGSMPAVASPGPQDPRSATPIPIKLEKTSAI